MKRTDLTSTVDVYITSFGVRRPAVALVLGNLLKCPAYNKATAAVALQRRFVAFTFNESYDEFLCTQQIRLSERYST